MANDNENAVECGETEPPEPLPFWCKICQATLVRDNAVGLYCSYGCFRWETMMPGDPWMKLILEVDPVTGADRFLSFTREAFEACVLQEQGITFRQLQHREWENALNELEDERGAIIAQYQSHLIRDYLDARSAMNKIEREMRAFRLAVLNGRWWDLSRVLSDEHRELLSSIEPVDRSTILTEHDQGRNERFAQRIGLIKDGLF